MVPLITSLSIFVNIYLMMKLNYLTWIRFAVWNGIGKSSEFEFVFVFVSFQIVFFTSYFMFSIAVLPHSSVVMYYHLMMYC